eukprot:2519058-Pyramimonas_sp.AAC.1
MLRSCIPSSAQTHCALLLHRASTGPASSFALGEAQLQLSCIAVAIVPVVGGHRGKDGPSQAKDCFGLDGEWYTSH